MFGKQLLLYKYRDLRVVAIPNLSYERFDWLYDSFHMCKKSYERFDSLTFPYPKM